MKFYLDGHELHISCVVLVDGVYYEKVGSLGGYGYGRVVTVEHNSVVLANQVPLKYFAEQT
jgi:Tfp pilus assembly protein PilP